MGTTASKPSKQSKKPFGLLKALFLGGLALVVTTALVIVFFGPAIAGAFVPGAIEKAVNPTIAGSIRVNGVSLTWSGPQAIESVEVLDANGDVVGVYEGTMDAGLIPLARGDLDLGAVTLTRTGDDAMDAQTAIRTSEALTSTAPPSDEPLRLPETLRGDFGIDLGDIRLEHEGAATTLVSVRADATLAPGVPTRVRLSADDASGNDAVRINASAPDLIAADGLVTLRGSGLTVEAIVHAQDDDTVRTLLALATGRTVDPAGGSARLAINLREDGGVLVPKDGASGVRLTGALPGDALRGLAGAGAVTRVRGAPSFVFATNDIAIPLPDSVTGLIDMSVLRLAGRLDVDPLRATLADGRDVGVDTLRVNLDYDPLEGDLVAEGRTGVSVDGTSAGDVVLNAAARGMAGDDGALRAGGPTRVSAAINARDVPSGFAQLFVPARFDLRDALGEGFDASAEVLLDTDDDADRPGQPALRLTLSGGGHNARASMVFDGGALRSAGPRGVVVSSERLGALARALLGPDAALTVDEGGAGEVVVRDALLAFGDGGLDLASSSATVSLEAESLTARQGDGGAFVIDSATASAELSAGDLSWSGDADLRARGERARLASAGRVDAIGTDAMSLSGSVDADNLPGSLASLAGRAVGDAVVGSVGATLTGRIATTDATTGVFRLDIAGEHGTLSGPFTLTGGELRTAGEAITLTTERPSAALNAFATGTPLAFDRAGAMTLAIEDLVVDLNADRRGAPLRGVVATLRVQASGLRGTIDSAIPMALNTLDTRIALDASGDLDASLDINAVVDGEPLTARGPFAVTPLVDSAGVVDLIAPLYTADIEGTIPPALARLSSDDAVREAARELSGGLAMPFSLRTSADAARTLGGLELVASSADGETRLTLPVGPEPRGLVVGDAELAFVYDQPLHRVLERRLLAGTAYEGMRVTREGAAARVEVPTFVLPLRNRQAPDLSNIASVRPRVVFDDPERPLVLENVPSPDGGPRVGPVGLRAVTLEYEQNAPFRRVPDRVFAQLALYKPGAEGGYSNVALGLRGSFSVPFDLLLGEATIQSDPRHLDAVLGLDGLGERLFGSRLRAEFTGRAAPADARDAPYSFSVTSQRLFARGSAWREDDGGFRFGRTPTGIALTADEASAMLLGAAGDDAGVRFADGIDINAVFTTLTLGPIDAPLSSADFDIASELRSTPITLVYADGMREDLGELRGTLRRVAPGRLAFDLAGERLDEGPALPDGSMRRPTVALRGVMTGFADDAGMPALADAGLEELEVDGSIPTALVDQLGSMNGLLVAALGVRTDVEARITPADTPGAPNRFEASFSSMNARGDVRGSVGDAGVVEVPAGAELSVSRITNALSERVLGGVFPMLTSFEKSAQDEPLRVTTTGLRVPTDGDLAKLDGDIRVDLGTLRFETSTLFGRLLTLTDNNVEGEIGRRLEPFELRVDEGVIRYTDVKVPLGEIEMVLTGRVNLKSRRVNTLVSVPYYALNDELASVVSRVPGVRRLTMIPIRVRGPLGSPEYAVDPDALIESLPDALGNTIGDLLGVPGGLLEGLGGNNDDDDR